MNKERTNESGREILLAEFQDAITGTITDTEQRTKWLERAKQYFSTISDDEIYSLQGKLDQPRFLRRTLDAITNAILGPGNLVISDLEPELADQAHFIERTLRLDSPEDVYILGIAERDPETCPLVRGIITRLRKQVTMAGAYPISTSGLISQGKTKALPRLDQLDWMHK